MTREAPGEDIGHGVTLRYVGWSPDRELNPQYADIPDIPKYGAVVAHTRPGGEPCEGFVTFDGPVARQIRPAHALWAVESWEPLTLSPSIRCHCGLHGYIREGQWVPA